MYVLNWPEGQGKKGQALELSWTLPDFDKKNRIFKLVFFQLKAALIALRGTIQREAVSGKRKKPNK